MRWHLYTAPVLEGSQRKKTREQRRLFFHLLLCSSKRHSVLFILHFHPDQIWVFDSESAHKKSELFRRSLRARANLDPASGLRSVMEQKAAASGGGHFSELVSCGRRCGILLLFLWIISRLWLRGKQLSEILKVKYPVKY